MHWLEPAAHQLHRLASPGWLLQAHHEVQIKDAEGGEATRSFSFVPSEVLGQGAGYAPEPKWGSLPQMPYMEFFQVGGVRGAESGAIETSGVSLCEEASSHEVLQRWAGAVQAGWQCGRKAARRQAGEQVSVGRCMGGGGVGVGGQGRVEGMM